MSWSTGSILYMEMLPHIVKHVPDFEARKKLHVALILEFEGYDCSSMAEVLYADDPDPAYRAAWAELYGEDMA